MIQNFYASKFEGAKIYFFVICQLSSFHFVKNIFLMVNFGNSEQ